MSHSGDARLNHGAPLHDRVHLPTFLPTYLEWMCVNGRFQGRR